MAKPHQLADGRFECQNCLKKFTKNEWTFKAPTFCSDKCRKEFHANSGMSLKKFETRVRQWVRDEMKLVAGETFTELLAALPETQKRKAAASAKGYEVRSAGNNINGGSFEKRKAAGRTNA